MQKNASCNRSGHAMHRCRQEGPRFSTKSRGINETTKGYSLCKKILLVMKLTTLLLTAALMGVSAKGVSQSVTLSGKNITLEKAFQTIRSQTGYHIFCDLDLLKGTQKVNLSAVDMPLGQFLDIIFKGQELQYMLQEQTIFVSKKTMPLPLPYANTTTPLVTIPVQGIVKDARGNILFGATIKVKGTGRSVINDENGRFDLSVNVGDVLVISYVGFKSQEVKISNNTDLVIVLERTTIDISAINVSVSTGYQTISKERATGSYSIITAKDLAEVPSNNIMERLEGKVPGVKFDIRGNTIQIRTTNTYGNTTAPLIVVDGFPMIPTGDNQKLTTLGNSVMANGSVLSSFNPNDIEQITFLKDAVATSIWGARGANGVIVIETKKGKRGAPSVNLSATFGVSKAPSISDLNWMSTAEYVDLEMEMLNKGFFTDALSLGYYNPLQAANPSEVQEWFYKVKRGTATQAQADAAIAEIASRNNYGQIEKYLLRTAVNQQYNLSVSGGGDNNSYYLSGNFNKDQPIFRSNSAQNVFLTGNFTNDLFDRRVKLFTGFSYQGGTTYFNNAAADALGQNATALRPYDMLVDANGNHLQRNVGFRPEVNDSLVAKGFLPTTYNAIDELGYSNTKNSMQQVRLNAGLNFKLTNWANLDVTGMYQRNANSLQSVDDVQSYAGRTLMNTYTVTNPSSGKPTYNLPYGGRYYLSDANAYDYNLRGVLNIHRNFNPDHQLMALAGGEIRETYSRSYASTRYGYNADGNTFATVDPNAQLMTMYGWTQNIGPVTTPVTEQKNRYLSYFGNGNYTYKAKYNLSASARFDDYTLLGLERSKRAKPFWSAGAKWSMGQESFMQNIHWLNGLDLRVTYGTGGSVPLAGSNVPLINLAATDPSTQLPIGVIESPGNQQLGWELTKTLNFGVDLRAFNNRLMLTADAYTKRSEGIITTLPYNSTYGWSTLQFNTGTLKSHGMELGITGELLKTRDWGITSVFNFAYGTNEVTDNRYNITQASNLIAGGSPVNGYPIGATFVYRSAGLDNKGQTQIYDRNNKIISNTTNLTSAFDINDLKYAGVRVAPYHGGFFNTFRYKRFEMRVQMTYYMGHIFMKPAITNYPTSAGYYFGLPGRQKDLANRWKEPGDEAFTDVPGLENVNNNSIVRYRNSDKLVRKADNIRLQQISLSYSFPKELLPQRVIKSLSVSGNARNLGILWRANKDGIDPEYLNANANYYSMSPVTSYMFNINASF